MRLNAEQDNSLSRMSSSLAGSIRDETTDSGCPLVELNFRQRRCNWMKFKAVCEITRLQQRNTGNISYGLQHKMLWFDSRTSGLLRKWIVSNFVTSPQPMTGGRVGHISLWENNITSSNVSNISTHELKTLYKWNGIGRANYDRRPNVENALYKEKEVNGADYCATEINKSYSNNIQADRCFMRLLNTIRQCYVTRNMFNKCSETDALQPHHCSAPYLRIISRIN
jgi:hypothetical protein